MTTSIPTHFSSTAIYGAQNSTNDTDCFQGGHKEWISTVVPVYVLLISVLGIVFNLFVLMVFLFHKRPCTIPEIYLTNLAAADLFLVSCLPFWAVNAMNRFNWPFSNSLCRLVSLSITMNAYCSIYFLVLVSIDRFMALVYPLSKSRMRRSKYAKMGCLLVWAFGLLLSIPVLIFREVQHFPQYGIHACFLNYPNRTVELLCDGMLVVFSFIIPILIISFCTVKIIQTLNNRLMEGLNRQKTEHKATTLVLVVLLAFLICWVPFHLVRIAEVLKVAEVLTGCTVTAILETCRQIVTYLAFFNSVLNPVLYVIVGKNFRKKVTEFFKQWSRDQSSTRLSRTSTRSVKSGLVL